jgi:thiamine pyrophosphate-dependent acetolactate synthase large subunit-like protein
MKRFEAIQAVLNQFTDELVIIANGYPSRDAFNAKDRPQNFYMIGSMGLASPIALGLALAQPQRKVIVFDGDGNLLMSLGMLAQIADAKPANLVHIVFDNETYGSTGSQATVSSSVNLAKMAEAAGYTVSEFADAREKDELGRMKDELQKKLQRVLSEKGPTFLLIKVSSEEGEAGKRVSWTPEEIANRFASAAKA